jgi:hypothetical protein
MGVFGRSGIYLPHDKSNFAGEASKNYEAVWL